MSKRKKRSLVLDVALSDRECFKILPDKKQQKNIYDKIHNKLVRKGLEGELLKNKMIAEVRAELFKLQEPYKPKEPKQIEDSQEDFFDRKSVRIRGYDMWSEHKEGIDPLDRELEIWEKNTERYMTQFCPVCKTNPCKCKKEGED